MRKYMQDVIDRLLTQLSYLNKQPTGINLSEKKLVDGTNMRMVRAGCIIRTHVKGNYNYLLGRVDSNNGQPVNPLLKTAGGYLHLSESRHGQLDRSVLEGLLRETKEEGFVGKYALKKDTIVPLEVIVSPQKGVLQWFSAELKNYPNMGFRKEVLFKRNKKKNQRIIIRWYSLDEIIYSLCTDDSRIQPETASAVASAHFLDSYKMAFKRNDLPNMVRDDGSLEIPFSTREKIIDKCGLEWLDPEESMKRCSVYYSIPKAKDIPKIMEVPYIKIFFMTDLLLHKVSLGIEELRPIADIDYYMKKKVPFSEWVSGFAKEYVVKNYERIIEEELVRSYVV